VIVPQPVVRAPYQVRTGEAILEHYEVHAVATKSPDDWMADLAAEYVAATLGVEVQPWDRCGRQGTHDLRFEQNGRSVAVEVKAVVDQKLREMESAIAQAGYVADSRLTRLWIVNLRHRAHIGNTRRGLPVLLAQLEARGWLDDLAWYAARHSQLGAELNRLGVRGLWSQEPTPDHPGGFAMLPAPLGEWDAHIPTLPAFVSDLLGDNDSTLVQNLRRQLGTATADERHAFLFVGWEHAVVWPLMTPSGDLPVEPPTLPPPIDGVWIASFSPETRVLAWFPEAGWIEGRRELTNPASLPTDRSFKSDHA
jgi:hypothetical protein